MRGLLLLGVAASVLLSKAPGYPALEREEGLRLKVYPDSAGYHTIGYGHLLTDRQKASGLLVIGTDTVAWHAGLTVAQAQALLTQDVGFAERAVNELVTRALTQHQFDALVSVAFNIGRPHFTTSGILRAVNAKRDAQVPREMARWVFAGGVKQLGLVTRRKREGALWRGEL